MDSGVALDFPELLSLQSRFLLRHDASSHRLWFLWPEMDESPLRLKPASSKVSSFCGCQGGCVFFGRNESGALFFDKRYLAHPHRDKAEAMSGGGGGGVIISQDLRYGRSLLHAGEAMFPYPTTEEKRRGISPGYLCHSCDAVSRGKSADTLDDVTTQSRDATTPSHAAKSENNALFNRRLERDGKSSVTPSPKLRAKRGREWVRGGGGGVGNGSSQRCSSLAENVHSLSESIVVHVDSSDSESSPLSVLPVATSERKNNSEQKNIASERKSVKEQRMRASGQCSLDGLLGRSADSSPFQKKRDGMKSAGASLSDAHHSAPPPPPPHPLQRQKSSLSRHHSSKDSFAESEDSYFSADDDDDRTTVDCPSMTTTYSADLQTQKPSESLPIQRSSTETSSVEFLPALSRHEGSLYRGTSGEGQGISGDTGRPDLSSPHRAASSVSTSRRPPSWPSSTGASSASPYMDARTSASRTSSYYTDARADQPSSTTTDVSFHSAVSSYQSRLSYHSAIDGSLSGGEDELRTLAPDEDADFRNFPAPDDNADYRNVTPVDGEHRPLRKGDSVVSDSTDDQKSSLASESTLAGSNAERPEGEREERGGSGEDLDEWIPESKLSEEVLHEPHQEFPRRERRESAGSKFSTGDLFGGIGEAGRSL